MDEDERDSDGKADVAEVAPEAEAAVGDYDRGRAGFPSLYYWATVTITVVATFWIMTGIARVSNILVLVLIASVGAVGLDPPVRWLERRLGGHRGWAVAIILAAALLVLGLFVLLVVPPLVRQAIALAKSVPMTIDQLSTQHNVLADFLRLHQREIQAFIATLPARIIASFGSIVSVTGQIGGFLFSLVTVVILTVYLMIGLPTARKSVVVFFRPPHREFARAVIEKSLGKISGYITGNFITSGIAGVLAGVGLVIIGIPYALPLALWMAVADLVPQVGGLLGAIPAIAVGLLISPLKGLLVALWYVAYQQLENNLIGPRVMSDAVDLSAPAVLVASLIGAEIAGFAGALLALPVAAVIKVVIEDVWYPAQVLGTSPVASSEPPTTSGDAD